MPIKTIGTNNWEEKMTVIKVMLQQLMKERKEKEVHIKIQEGKIVKLTIKLEKWPT